VKKKKKGGRHPQKFRSVRREAQKRLWGGATQSKEDKLKHRGEKQKLMKIGRRSGGNHGVENEVELNPNKIKKEEKFKIGGGGKTKI